MQASLWVRVVACEARGPGFDSSSNQMVFLLFLGIGGRKKMDPETINSLILYIHVDKRKIIPNCAIQLPTCVRARYGSKKPTVGIKSPRTSPFQINGGQDYPSSTSLSYKLASQTYWKNLIIGHPFVSLTQVVLPGDFSLGRHQLDLFPPLGRCIWHCPLASKHFR